MDVVRELTDFCHAKQEYPYQTSLPSVSHFKRGFLCFSKLHGPANLDACRDSLRPFSVSVYEAIDELHQFGYAHLDIILPNICYKQQGNNKWIAVLIDLDTLCLENLQPISGNRYLLKYTMTAAQNDWRQYAVLIECVYRKIEVNDEYRPEFANELQFLKPSYDNGEKPNLDDVKRLPGNEPITEKLWQSSN